MFTLPFERELQAGNRFLLAGAGGGFDIFCGLPLYFALRDQGKEVHLANLSFTHLEDCSGDKITPVCRKITADSTGPGYINYFPEGYLSQWFREQGDDVAIYAFHRTGVVPLRETYERLLAELQFDTLVLVDGGTDSLMRGDEEGLGTPHEDIASLAATLDLPVERKLLACLGFGVDHYHDVCHYRFLEAVAELTETGAFLGAFTLLDEMPTVRRYREAVEYVQAKMPRHPSIVNSSILSALAGHYGDYHATNRTTGSELWINPLMSMYWAFQLEPVTRRVQYLQEMLTTESYGDIHIALTRWVAMRTSVRETRGIPL